MPGVIRGVLERNAAWARLRFDRRDARMPKIHIDSSCRVKLSRSALIDPIRSLPNTPLSDSATFYRRCSSLSDHHVPGADRARGAGELRGSPAFALPG